jgi:hypothetical protein
MVDGENIKISDSVSDTLIESEVHEEQEKESQKKNDSSYIVNETMKELNTNLSHEMRLREILVSENLTLHTKDELQQRKCELRQLYDFYREALGQ